MIGTRTIDGHRALTLADPDGELEAAFVPEAGMIGCSLLHRGEELLGQRNGLSGYVGRRSTMGIPLLYPWANRLSRERFDVAGRELDLGRSGDLLKRDANGLPIHGLLSAFGGWSVVRHEASGEGAELEAEIVWQEQPELLAAYPFPHRLLHRASISPGRLAITTTIEAGDDGPVPIAFGFHPYLAPPGEPRQSWRVELPLGPHLLLDDRGLPTGEREATAPAAGPLGDRAFDDLYESAAGGLPLAVGGGGRRIALSMDAGYPFTQIYSPAAEALIAIEPMTAPTDALTGKPAPPLVAPGTAFSARFEIAVS